MADLTTGAAVAGYRIEAVLGHGSTGTVYSALDTGPDRRVALKVLTPELFRDERFRERFLRESKLAPGARGRGPELRGDEALVALDSPRQALRFALGLQAQMLDAGEAIPVEDRFRGGALNRAARLCAIAKTEAGRGARIRRRPRPRRRHRRRGVRLPPCRAAEGYAKPVGVVEIHRAEPAPKRELTVIRRAHAARLRTSSAVARRCGTRRRAIAAVVPLALLSSGNTADVSRMLRSAPPAAPCGTQSGPPPVFSSRIGCQIFRPQDWGYVDLAALCLRGKS